MRCQYCNEQEGVIEVNYNSEKNPQYAWMCKECAKNFKPSKRIVRNPDGESNK